MYTLLLSETISFLSVSPGNQNYNLIFLVGKMKERTEASSYKARFLKPKDNINEFN